MDNNADRVIERLMQIYEVEDDISLGEKLSVSKKTISAWRNRDSIPFKHCLETANSRQVSLDWLIAGEGEMYRGENGALRSANAPYEKPNSFPSSSLGMPTTSLQRREIEEPQLQPLIDWLETWWENASVYERIWFLEQMKRTFPEFNFIDK